MRLLLAALPLFLAGPALAQHSRGVPQLCDAGRAPEDGQEVEARGTLFLDQHGTLFSDLERRCSVQVDAAPGSAARDELIRLHATRPNRVDATLRGRLRWRDESPGMGLPRGYWSLDVSIIADVVVTLQTVEQAQADLQAIPKTITVVLRR